MPELRPSRYYLSLNGRWQFRPSNQDTPPSSWTHTVPVPALVDAARPGYEWKKFRYHWYRTRFEVPYVAEAAFVVIEQAMFGTDVWLNGRYLGGDIACYTSQEYDAHTALKAEGENELIVRVRQREHLPPHSAVGKDQERTDWIPGIWGDVYFMRCGVPRVRHIQVVPHLDGATAEVRITVENNSAEPISCVLSSRIVEKNSGAEASRRVDVAVDLRGASTQTVVTAHQIINMSVWSPETPFLYDVETSLHTAGKSVDQVRTSFGMREFCIAGSDFQFNGKRIFLKGGNIAFHRFLSDADRSLLPWSRDWIKRVLIDVPKAHNFNFFRAHIGQMYNRWYDIADEYGMLIQNEWPFWTTGGTKLQIEQEFTRWLQDNWNHPSIIVWDALNECTDDVVQREIVPQMKKLDPTRPWESVDFVEDHPYIYSLGPVLNERKLGYTRSLEEIEKSETPSVVNEFLWWWLDKDSNPTSLMTDVAARWLGPHYTKEALIAHQSFLVQELVELFRRMRVDAIQPFVYLSNNAGPTGHWFLDDVKDLRPKPILSALANAFSPFGISVELWDRHFVAGDHRSIRLFVFNDNPQPRQGFVRIGLIDGAGNWVSTTRLAIIVQPSDCLIIPVTMDVPNAAGAYVFRAELSGKESSMRVSWSEKPVHVFGPLGVPENVKDASIAVVDRRGELSGFLRGVGARCEDLNSADLSRCSVVLVGEGQMIDPVYHQRMVEVRSFVESGGALILIEPEFGIEGRQTIPVTGAIDLTVVRRADIDRGGYDSYLFADDHQHPLWKGIDAEHLKMFNGGFGGEIVSQHDVSTNVPWTVLARCGLKLNVAAVFEVSSGVGKIIVSRLQVRQRLVPGGQRDSLYTRRVDPVLQRYLLNLLSYSMQDRYGRIPQ